MGTSILMQLDGSAAVAEDIGRQMLTYRRRLTPAEIFARIDAVDADTIKRVANELFYNKSPPLLPSAPSTECQTTPDWSPGTGGSVPKKGPGVHSKDFFPSFTRQKF